MLQIPASARSLKLSTQFACQASQFCARLSVGGGLCSEWIELGGRFWSVAPQGIFVSPLSTAVACELSASHHGGV